MRNSPRLHRFCDTPARRLAGLTALVCVLAAAGVTLSSASVAAAPTPQRPVPPLTTSPGTAHSVTLLTGDRVEYLEGPDGRPRAIIDPAERPNRLGVTFTTAAVAGPGGRPALYVVPSDVEAYLAAGSVDRELFNVRALTREGLDDKDSKTLPVILTYETDPTADNPPASLATRALPAIHAKAMQVVRAQTEQFWDAIGPPPTSTRQSTGNHGRATLQRGVRKVWLDRRITTSLDQSVPQIGAPTAWQAGYDGSGVTVAVLDTGVDANHPDLQGKIVASSDFSESGTTADGHGHGTHCASTVVGSGAASGGRYRGVAPGAKLMVGKVMSDDGAGLESWIMAGMEWAAHGGAKVISMSLGSEPTDGTDPVSQEIESLSTQTGALFVVAAGNYGAPVSVAAPGAATSALTVGAVDKQDHLADFSSRGPRAGDGAAKPEIVAPGVNIVAARATGTSLGTPVDDSYTSLSGTSMATPHVAGAAAILAGRHPDWSAQRLKDGLVNGATDVGARWSDQGTGRVDVARTLRQEVTGTAAVNLGRIQPGSGVFSRPIRYANSGTRPVTLNLALSLTGWNRQPAPGGLGRLSAGTVTVPAGGTASVDLVVDPATVTGAYGGTVVATTPDGMALRTVVAGYFAPPSANLTVRVTDYRGQPAASASVYLVDANADPVYGNDPFATPITTAYVANGTGVVKVSRGAVLTAMTSQTTFAINGRRTDLLVSPEVVVNGDSQIDLDARRAVAHRVHTTDPTDELAKATEVVRGTAGSVVSLIAFTRFDPDTVTYATPVPAPLRGDLDTYDKRTLADAGVRMSATRGAGTGPPVAGAPLHPRYDPYGAPAALAGNRVLGLVWAGEGKPADLAGVNLTGRVALVGIRIPDGTANPVNFAAQAATAATQATAKAGAVATAIYVDQAGAAPLARPGAVPVPQLFLSYDEGAALRGWFGGGAVSVTLTGNPSPRTNLNLLYPDRGVPQARTDVAVPAQLAMIPTRYHADKPMRYEKNWYAFGAHSLAAYRERVLFPAPAARMEYVGPADATVNWTRWITQNDQAPNGRPLVASLIARNQYPVRNQVLPEERWYEGPILENEPASTPGGVCGLCRGGPDGNLLIPAWHLGDSTTDHIIQSWPDYRSEIHLFRGATEIPSQPLSTVLPMPTFRLPPTPDNYRMVVDGPTPWNPSVRPVQRATTEWSFRSAAPSSGAGSCPGSLPGGCAHQPLIQIKYRLGLDLSNRAPAGTPFTFTVLADLPAAATGGGTIAGLSLWSSADAGASWQPATVASMSPTRYQVTVNNPAQAGGDGTVWLRAVAWDSAGNRVQQTVRGAYTLAGPTVR